MGEASSGVQETGVGKRVVFRIPAYDVIDHLDAENGAGLCETGRALPVLAARRRVAGWMDVQKDDRRGVGEDRGLEDLARTTEEVSEPCETRLTPISRFLPSSIRTWNCSRSAAA